MKILSRNLQFTVPWDYSEQNSLLMDLYAREIYYQGNEDKPYLVYLQGGPGFPSPRPTSYNGWLKPFLERYRVILLDQRGTGRSTRVDETTPELITTWHLSRLRADNIARDLEFIREELGVDRWNLFGQSFGGFCITTYLSMYPHNVDRAFLTGGIPGAFNEIEEIYTHTYAMVEERSKLFYRKFYGVEDQIRRIAHHLDTHEEFLPTGERLTSRRFRMLGINLGRGIGMEALAYLLEAPFAGGREVGTKLSGEFLSAVGAQLSYARGPLYAAVHEAIYGQGSATNWAAHRLRAEIDGFAEDADPLDTSSKYYMTGEHIYPWQFIEDPALKPFRDVAFELASKEDWPELYNADALGDSSAIVAAAVYVDDIFVPFDLSRQTAKAFADIRLHITNEYQHDGIGHNGDGIIRTLIEKADL
ncbi:MAG: alpha/beta fold hydrolase [Corynebacterium sp.]|nr:alpha/beta fold hydrolase [Corynebacterium sp.]